MDSESEVGMLAVVPEGAAEEPVIEESVWGAVRALREGGSSKRAIARGFLPASFGHLVAEYLPHHAWTRKKDPAPDERAIRYKLLPRWGDTPVAAIDRRTVIAYLDEARVTAGPVAANRLHALLSKMFNFGLQRDLVSFNPVAGIPKNRETPKDRYLSESELWTLLRALQGDDGDAAHQVAKLILLTGMRPGEAMDMTWAELDGDEWYNLRAAQVKNGVASRVYLSEPARAVIAGRRLRSDGSAYVFPGLPGRPLASIRKPLLEIRRATGIDFTPHDLRRTCATHVARLGFSDLVPEILNHKPRGVTSIYNRYRFDKEKRQALTAWAEELRRIVSETASTSELASGEASASRGLLLFLSIVVRTPPPGLWKRCESGEGGPVEVGMGGGPGAGFQARVWNGGPGAAVGGGSGAGGPCWVRGFHRRGAFHRPCVRWAGACGSGRADGPPFTAVRPPGW
jgi:integrase